MNKIRFKIATPERVVFEGDIDRLTCPTQLGEVTILPNHIPLVANITAGELKVLQNGTARYMFVAGGFLEVRPQNEIIILADAAEPEEEIDIKRAEEARERARKAMTEKTLGEEEYAETLSALERSLARIRVGQRKKYKDVGGAGSSPQAMGRG